MVRDYLSCIEDSPIVLNFSSNISLLVRRKWDSQSLPLTEAELVYPNGEPVQVQAQFRELWAQRLGKLERIDYSLKAYKEYFRFSLVFGPHLHDPGAILSPCVIQETIEILADL